MDDLEAALRDASGLLLCLDFDGTLAPIVEDPDAATATPANERAVATLSTVPGVTTAVVSGRALADVRERIDGPSIYAGNHGLELERDGRLAIHPVARVRASRLGAVCALLEETVGTVPNCHIENKELTGTVHFRSVPEAAEPIVEQRTREIVDRLGEGAIEVSPGKSILEIGPNLPWGKGNTVALLEMDAPDGTLSIYVGDDVTDESAFEAIEPEGFGVIVGSEEPSAASITLKSPAEVETFLEWLGSSGVELLDSG